MKKIIIFASLVLALVFLFGCGAPATTLNVLNWGEYLEPELLARFESETGIKISYQTCPDNETMYATISAPGSKIDVVFPSEYMVQKMVREDLLLAIDYSQVPNAKNIAPFITDYKLDTNKANAVPYTWGTVGILYNKNMVTPEEASSWNVLWNEKFKGEMYMYDSMRDSIAVAQLKLGIDINSTDLNELNRAGDELIAQKPLVKAYGTDDIRVSMLNGSGALGVVYSGDATRAMLESDNLAYSIPQEGSNIWLDYVAIAKNTQNAQAAHKFIDFLLNLDVATDNCSYIGYSSPVGGVLDNMPPEYRELNSFNPPDDVLSRLTTFKDLGEAEKLYGDVWLKVKAR